MVSHVEGLISSMNSVSVAHGKLSFFHFAWITNVSFLHKQDLMLMA